MVTMKNMHRCLPFCVLMGIAVSVTSVSDAAQGKAAKQGKAVPLSTTVMEDGTTNYFANGDFSGGFTSWNFHGNTKALVTLVTEGLPTGVKGQAFRYRKTDAIPNENYHLNHPTTLPSPGT